MMRRRPINMMRGGRVPGYADGGGPIDDAEALQRSLVGPSLTDTAKSAARYLAPNISSLLTREPTPPPPNFPDAPGKVPSWEDKRPTSAMMEGAEALSNFVGPGGGAKAAGVGMAAAIPVFGSRAGRAAMEAAPKPKGIVAETPGIGQWNNWYHGTRENHWNELRKDPFYMTTDEEQAAYYALGNHLGGTGTGNPNVKRFELRTSDVHNIDSHIVRAFERDYDADVGIGWGIAEAKKRGARYVEYHHPNIGGEGTEHPVRISLYPHEDLTHTGTTLKLHNIIRDPSIIEMLRKYDPRASGGRVMRKQPRNMMKGGRVL